MRNFQYCDLKIGLVFCQSMLVVACDLNSAPLRPSAQTATSAAPQGWPVLENLGTVNDPNQDSDLWANVIHEDLADEPSRIDIVAHNLSHYMLEMVGCDPHNYLNNNLANIPANYKFPLSRNYDQRWQFLDPSHSGLFDTTQINRNSLSFSHAPDAGQFNCYYRVFIPAANDSIYIKLTNNFYSASSYSVDGKPVLTKPQTDHNRTLQHSIWQEIIPPIFMDSLFGVGSFKAIVSHINLFNPEQYLQLKLDAAIQEWVSDVNFKMLCYRQANYIPDAFTKQVFYRQSLIDAFKINSGGNRYLRIPDTERFLRRITVKSGERLEGIVYERDKQQLAMKIVSENDSITKLVAIDRASPYISGEPLPSAEYEIERLFLQKDPKVFLKLFARGKYTNFVSGFSHPIDLEALGLDSDAVVSFGAANTALDLASLGISIGVDVGFAAVQYFVLQPLINGIFDQPGIGTFSTGINHLRFETISASDAASWNEVHDLAHQIAANTKFNVTARPLSEVKLAA